MLNDPIFKLVAAVVVASLVGYLINQLPAIKQFTGRGWLIAGLLGCITLLGLAMQVLIDASIAEEIKIWVRYGSIAVLTLLLVGVGVLVWACRDRSTEPQDLRSRLLKDLKDEVQKRLKYSLNDLVLIPLAWQEEREPVGDAPERPLVPVEVPAPAQTWLRLPNPVRWLKQWGNPTLIELPPEETMLAVFERVNRKLLILGEPGAGKTITLLTLAQELIQKAIADPTQPIPVIFELSNWKQDSQSIADWLVEQLSDRVAKKTAEQWLGAGLVLPLLDGLDELGLVRQQKATEALNRFVAANLGADLVVCCRNEEFLQAGVILQKLNSSVCLQPLSDRQIEGYFQQMQRSQIWRMIQQEPGLRQLLEPDAEGKTGMLRIPLFLKMMLEVKPQENRPIRNRQELLDAYIVYRLDPKVIEQEQSQTGRHEWAFAPGEEPSQETTRRYLVWLAKQLVSTKQTEFLIEKMQPTLLETRAQQRHYWLILDMSFGLIGGLVGGLGFGLISGLVWGVSFGLISGLTVGISTGLLGELDKIEPVESFLSNLTRQRSLERLKQWLLVGLITGAIFGSLVGLVGGLNGGLMFGLLSGPITGLIFGLTRVLKDELKIRAQPNQGIWQSTKNAWIIVSLSYPPIAVILLSGIPVARKAAGVEPLSSVFPPQILLLALVAPLAFGYCLGGGAACTKHFALRLILHRSRRIPWNYARFLRYATERRLIQQIGGRYRFLHRELLEHFAQMPHS